MLGRFAGTVAVCLFTALGAVSTVATAENASRRRPRQSAPVPVKVVNTPTVTVANMPGGEEPVLVESPPHEPFATSVELPPGQIQGVVLVPENCLGRYIVVEQVSGYVGGWVPYFEVAATDGYPTWTNVLNRQIFALPDTLTPGTVPLPPAASYSVTLRLPTDTAGLVFRFEAEDPASIGASGLYLSGYCRDVP
jgi:hypothetical protein